MCTTLTLEVKERTEVENISTLALWIRQSVSTQSQTHSLSIGVSHQNLGYVSLYLDKGRQTISVQKSQPRTLDTLVCIQTKVNGLFLYGSLTLEPWIRQSVSRQRQTHYLCIGVHQNLGYVSLYLDKGRRTISVQESHTRTLDTLVCIQTKVDGLPLYRSLTLEPWIRQSVSRQRQTHFLCIGVHQNLGYVSLYLDKGRQTISVQESRTLDTLVCIQTKVDRLSLYRSLTLKPWIRQSVSRERQTDYLCLGVSHQNLGYVSLYLDKGRETISVQESRTLDTLVCIQRKVDRLSLFQESHSRTLDTLVCIQTKVDTLSLYRSPTLEPWIRQSVSRQRQTDYLCVGVHQNLGYVSLYLDKGKQTISVQESRTLDTLVCIQTKVDRLSLYRSLEPWIRQSVSRQRQTDYLCIGVQNLGYVSLYLDKGRQTISVQESHTRTLDTLVCIQRKVDRLSLCRSLTLEP